MMYCRHCGCECVVVHQIEDACSDCDLNPQLKRTYHVVDGNGDLVSDFGLFEMDAIILAEDLSTSYPGISFDVIRDF